MKTISQLSVGKRHASLATLALSAVIMAGCSGGDAAKTSTNVGYTLALKECRVPKVDTAVKCGTLEVFENRETKAGRKIPINIVVLPASARVKEPDPVFLFAGGPGQAAGDLAPQALAILGPLNTKRDIVLIDQRGTGKSNLLQCKMPEDETLDMTDLEKRRQITVKLIAECRDELSKKADLTQYGTTTAMMDYDEVRAALGAERINLWGGSYGTRSSMEYLRRYPDRVRTVTIDGVAPPSMPLPAFFARDAGAALEAMFTSCEKNKECSTRYPNLRATLATLQDDLRKNPRTLKVKHPLTGVPRDMVASEMSVMSSIFSALYVPQLAALVPEAINAASKSDFAPLYALTGGMTEGLSDSISFGMRLSVMCGEDLPRVTPALREQSAALKPFGDMFNREFGLACESWPKGKVLPDFFTPVTSDKPVLIYSGGLDPVTPPSWGEEAKKTLSNSVHFVAPNIGHGVSHHACAPMITKKFIETASIANLDGKCLEKIPRPTFYQGTREAKKEDAAKTMDKKNEATK
jgi:pimeloyl-ACP methyl ester carboxylesterase